MRDIVVRNLTSPDWLNRDCVVTERMQEGDFTTRVVRRCTYRVESQTTLPSMRTPNTSIAKPNETRRSRIGRCSSVSWPMPLLRSRPPSSGRLPTV